MSLVIPGVRAALTPQWVRHPLWQIARQVPAFHLDFTTGQAIERIGGRLGTFTRPSSVKNVWNGSQFVEVAADVPALQRDPATGLWGYLHEPAATNSFLNSNLLTTANGWTHGEVTASAGSTSLGALGVGTAVRETTATSAHEIFRSLTLTSGVQVTLSVLLQAQGRRFVRLFIGLGSGLALGDRVAFVDLQDGVISQSPTGGSTATIRNYGNGLFFCTLTVTPSATASTACGFSMSDVGTATASYTGETSRGVDAWNLQLETGPIATSPIITTGSAVTCAADTWTWTGAQFSGWYNQAGGVFVWDGLAGSVPTGQFPRLYQIDDGTDTNRLNVSSYANSSARHTVVTGGSPQAAFDTGSLLARGSPLRAATSYATDNIRGSANGSAVVSDLSATLPTPTTLQLGNSQAGNVGNNFNGLIRQLAYFPPGPAADRIRALSAL